MAELTLTLGFMDEAKRYAPVPQEAVERAKSQCAVFQFEILNTFEREHSLGFDLLTNSVSPLKRAVIKPLRDLLTDTLKEFQTDALLLQKSGKPHLLVADMDSTMIGQECLDELADKCGFGDRVRAITERAMAGELNFESALKERVALLKGYSESLITEVIDERIELTGGAKSFVDAVHATGQGRGKAVLVSGGFLPFVSHVGQLCGFDQVRANTLQVDNHVFTGEVIEPILGREAKLQSLKDFMRLYNIGPHDTIAIGDGANDLDMITFSNMGVAFHAKDIVRQQADVQINFCDLQVLTDAILNSTLSH